VQTITRLVQARRGPRRPRSVGPLVTLVLLFVSACGDGVKRGGDHQGPTGSWRIEAGEVDRLAQVALRDERERRREAEGWTESSTDPNVRRLRAAIDEAVGASRADWTDDQILDSARVRLRSAELALWADGTLVMDLGAGTRIPGKWKVLDDRWSAELGVSSDGRSGRARMSGRFDLVAGRLVVSMFAPEPIASEPTAVPDEGRLDERVPSKWIRASLPSPSR
jgi:hypothetical protein